MSNMSFYLIPAGPPTIPVQTSFALDMDFNSAFSDPTSTAYQNLAAVVTSEVHSYLGFKI